MLEYIPAIANQALKVGNIIAALAIVENACGETPHHKRGLCTWYGMVGCNPRLSYSPLLWCRYDETKLLKAMPAAVIPDAEPALLAEGGGAMFTRPLYIAFVVLRTKQTWGGGGAWI
jgi:hypothetical protein